MKMKLAYPISILLISVLASCDKVENPIKPAILVDTTFYPGNWEDYPYPTFTANTNTNRNILLEDFTGHRCPNCPAAAAEAKTIESANPDRVFVASVHAGPGGLTSFQDIAGDCGTISNPNDEFCTVFYNDESIAYGAAFQSGFGFFGNPSGALNRKSFSGFIFQPYTSWQAGVSQIIAENDLKVNIQAHTNYYSETNGFYLHVETEFLEDRSGDNYNLVTYLVENHAADFQDSMSIVLEDYEHHNIFRGCLDGLAWGRTLTGSYTAGEKTYYDYSYQLPDGKTNEDFHLLIYVYDVATYEVMQVIKKTL